ncbi:TraR/DksA family transcriptional regulator [Paludibaculum fermentans]|uniref:TraR/DksA family transcriptional regulator n=1 Tax=Paludibaculum fermentans TaxID=1473598 RepID=UPI003EB71AA4
MNTAGNGSDGFRSILERKELELVEKLHNREDLAIEKSADQADETQRALERELAIRNADRDSSLLGEVRAALRRVRGGTFGACIECDEAINPKRLQTMPWAARCVHCQDASERDRQGSESSFRQVFADAQW